MEPQGLPEDCLAPLPARPILQGVLAVPLRKNSQESLYEPDSGLSMDRQGQGIEFSW